MSLLAPILNVQKNVKSDFVSGQFIFLMSIHFFNVDDHLVSLRA